MTLAVFACVDRRLLRRHHRRRRACSRGRRDDRRRAVARPVDRLRRAAAHARGARVPRPLRAAVRRPHDLRRRHLHRRARHAHRPADRRLRRSSLGAAHRARQRRLGAARCAGWSLAVVPAVVVLRRRRRRRLVRQQLHRQAERAGARAAVHRAQHRDDARRRTRSTASRSIRSPPTPASRRSTPRTTRPTLQNIRLWDWRALQDTLRQIQEIRTYYDFPDIDIDRYRLDGTVRQMMLARARAERREAAGEQPQLDQRKADLHARLRRDDEPGQRLHAGGAADSDPRQHAGAEHRRRRSTVTRPEIYFGELTNTDVYVKTRQKEFNYPQGETQQPHVVRRARRHPARRLLPPPADRARSRRHRQAAVQRRRDGRRAGC